MLLSNRQQLIAAFKDEQDAAERLRLEAERKAKGLTNRERSRGRSIKRR